jgi:hypothetical protein
VRESLLDEAKSLVLGDRNKAYDSPTKNFTQTADLWSAYKGVDFTAADVAAMMILVKVARLTTSPTKLDTWTDIAGYGACGAEAALDTDAR